MAKLIGATPERIADHFVNYLFDEYQGSRHVRRVASWVGFIVLGIENVAGTNWRISPKRQLRFDYQGRSFKAKYNHKTGPRGGIDIVEVLPERGSPEGETIARIPTLEEAARFYTNAGIIMGF